MERRDFYGNPVSREEQLALIMKCGTMMRADKFPLQGKVLQTQFLVDGRFEVVELAATGTAVKRKSFDDLFAALEYHDNEARLMLLKEKAMVRQARRVEERNISEEVGVEEESDPEKELRDALREYRESFYDLD
jgi:hypothetical protein